MLIVEVRTEQKSALITTATDCGRGAHGPRRMLPACVWGSSCAQFALFKHGVGELELKMSFGCD